MSAPHTNRLAEATSPYLLQHARNPVDWYPWGAEALGRAQQEDRPIFLSVGYSSCHWCHVMEHESFEDEDTALLMNSLFINIKVDREERPDLDEIYMQAVQLFSGGHGGWPMSVFLTPRLEPYFAGTYFPPAPRHGMPGFKTILKLTSDAYRERRSDVDRTTQQVVAALQQLTVVHGEDEVPGPPILRHAYETLENSFDSTHGGFGGAPKFPHSMDVAFLLRYGRRAESTNATSMALRTLRKIARGGICDQLGGGFHRYATDARWLVPHFEKMLYDNALLARTYLEAFQTSGDVFFRTVTEQTLDWVGREMTSPEGGFYSAQDADSEGVEGKFFAWTADEIDAVCGAADGRIVREYFGVTASGNFEDGTNVLSVPRDLDVVAVALGVPEPELAAIVERARVRLLEVRNTRIRPGLDDKVLAAWNGLMIRAFAQAYQVLRRAEDLARARAAAECVLRHSSAGVFRTLRDGRTSGPGFLDDWTCMIAAFLDLYEATFEPRWLEIAEQWNARVIEEFWDAGEGGFFFTGRQHETLLARSRNTLDQATPSGSSVHTGNLLRLGHLLGEDRWLELAVRNMQSVGQALRQHPSAMGEMLCALDFYLGPSCEVAVVGADAGAEALAQAVFTPFFPNKVVAGWPRGAPPPDLALLRDRPLVDGHAAAYVCRNQTCLAPVTSPGQVQQTLADAASLHTPGRQ